MCHSRATQQGASTRPLTDHDKQPSSVGSTDEPASQLSISDKLDSVLVVVHKIGDSLETTWAYLTPANINKYYDRNYATCPRFGELRAGLLYMRWSCPHLHTYWTSVTASLTACTEHPELHKWEVGLEALVVREVVVKAEDEEKEEVEQRRD
ncbi:hypothetical protein NDU88_004924 [Pleurodeles waltl]|uniref:Uncharacterized protein n=1 Tax=Pleurodeles waltl TaxID=8319 RepID=A0AAV7LLF2_PLEWA|nr:hypothetical protein NDU88_004924 [Pleurodeles waltl]